MEDIEIDFEHATFIRRVQWVPRTGEMRIKIAGRGKVPNWYAFSNVPRSVYDGLKAQIQGAQRQPTGQPKGHKRFSVGTYFSELVEHNYGQRSVDGPLA